MSRRRRVPTYRPVAWFRRHAASDAGAASLAAAAISALLAALVAAAAGPTAVVAQEAPGLSAREAQLTARLDSLRARMAALPARSQGIGDLRPMPRLDTTVVRGIRVVTPVEDAAAAARWARDGLRPVESRIGPIPAVPDPPTIHVDWPPITVPYDPAIDWVRVLRIASPDEVGRAFDGAIARTLTESLPAPVQAWLSGPLGTEADAYRELVTSRTPLTQDCVAGDTDACAVALGLRPIDDGALSPEQREGIDAMFLRDPPPQPLGPDHYAFVSPEVRRSFLHYLLGTRPGALERLMTVDDPTASGRRPPPHDRAAGFAGLLERAAGAPLNPIVADWRDDVLSHPPIVLPASTVGTTLLWILLFTGLATRSTRWRAG